MTNEPSKTEIEISTEASADITVTGTVRVLLVDDDASFSNVASQLLEMQGSFRVEAARNVWEALEKLEKGSYDAVVSDYQMPGKNGLEFLEELRQKGNGIPFVLFTGKGREEVAAKALNLGADQYIDKHGDPEAVYCELAHAILQAVERKATQTESFKKEAKLRAVLESSPEAITVTDLTGAIIECNQAALDMRGCTSKSEIVGKNAFDFVSENDRKRALENAKIVLEHGLAKDIEYRLIGKDGLEFSAELLYLEL